MGEHEDASLSGISARQSCMAEVLRISSLLSEEAGQSLLELLVVLAISFLLACVGVPGFAELKQSISRNSARNQINFDLSRTRAEAMAKGARAIMRFNETGSGYTVGIDYFPYSSSSETDETLYTSELPGNVNLSGVQELIFDSRGYLIDTDGSPIDLNINLNDHGGCFLTATIYPIGGIYYFR